MAAPSAPAIGIDLGTTYSCVGVLHNGKVKILENQQGRTTMPSYVAFTNAGRLVGERAKEYTLIDPENTVNNVKRLIGRTMDDEHVKEDIELYPFRVVEGENGKPLVKVRYEGMDRLFGPEEVSAVVLGELKTLAEEFLNMPVKQAVITVPAYFTDAQRQGTMDAGRIAGLDVLGTINEPTAAALAYGFDNAEVTEPCTLLVYDFGGGTFDVSVLSVVNGQVTVLATRGNSHLGGEDIDNILSKHFASEFLRQQNVDLHERAKTVGNAKKALRRIQLKSEKAKIKLSDDRSASVDLDWLYEKKDFQSSMTRVFFEEKCQELIRDTTRPVLEAVEAANLALDDITKIVLVGGSTRIPLVGKVLKDLFPNTEFCGSINPDEAVAYGAAIKAAMLTNVDPRVLRNVHLVDVTPLGLGIDTFGGVMATIILRGTPVPAQKKKIFTTSRDYQTEICFQVFEGERTLTRLNHLLGEFTLIGIPPAPKKMPQVEVTFAVDANGILKVKATDVGTGCENGIEITNTRGRMSKEAIERAVQEALRMREEDEKFKRKIQARECLEFYANQIAKSLRNPALRNRLDTDQIRSLERKIDESLRMYESFQDPGEADFEEKRNELESIWNPVVTRLWPKNNSNQDAPAYDSFYAS